VWRERLMTLRQRRPRMRCRSSTCGSRTTTSNGGSVPASCGIKTQWLMPGSSRGTPSCPRALAERRPRDGLCQRGPPSARRCGDRDRCRIERDASRSMVVDALTSATACSGRCAPGVLLVDGISACARTNRSASWRPPSGARLPGPTKKGDTSIHQQVFALEKSKRL